MLGGDIYPDWWSGVNGQQAVMTQQLAAQQALFEGKHAVDANLMAQERAGSAAEDSIPSSSQAATMASVQAVGSAVAGSARQTAAENRKVQDAAHGAFYQDQLAVIQRHAPYCSDRDASAGRCQAVAATMQDRDIRFDKMLEPGDGRKTFSAAEIEAARAFVKNVTFEMAAQLPDTRSQQGKALRAYELADDAVMSLASNSLNAIIARRSPVDGEPSFHELMSNEVEKRFLSPEWYAAESGRTTAPLLTELLHMQALEDVLALEKSRARERIEMMLAMQTERLNRKDILPRLENQRGAAARAGQ
ncbi:hypothetical protein VNPA141818_42010 [Pseudomonas aeruginosa]|nr:hypothetical protein VNPA141818_42010 [Pseudomonas aeruginosa]